MAHRARGGLVEGRLVGLVIGLHLRIGGRGGADDLLVELLADQRVLDVGLELRLIHAGLLGGGVHLLRAAVLGGDLGELRLDLRVGDGELVFVGRVQNDLLLETRCSGEFGQPDR